MKYKLKKLDRLFPEETPFSVESRIVYYSLFSESNNDCLFRESFDHLYELYGDSDDVYEELNNYVDFMNIDLPLKGLAGNELRREDAKLNEVEVYESSYPTHVIDRSMVMAFLKHNAIMKDNSNDYIFKSTCVRIYALLVYSSDISIVILVGGHMKTLFEYKEGWDCIKKPLDCPNVGPWFKLSNQISDWFNYHFKITKEIQLSGCKSYLNIVDTNTIDIEVKI